MATQLRRPPMWLLAPALFAPVLIPAPVSAQGWIAPDRPGPGPAAWSQVQRVHSHIQVRIEDRVAHVEVEEHFRNAGGRVAEGTYHYPLPGETVFSGYSLFQGEEELTGETMDAQEARAIYEEIVRRQKDPALIELVGHGLLRARIFPIQPGETRKVILRYTQLLDRAGEAVAFQYSGGRAERGGGWILPAGDARPTGVHPPSGGRPPAPTGLELATPTLEVTVRDGERFLDPFSPTHRLQVDRVRGELRVRPASELTGRFLLLLPLAGAPVRLGLTTHRPSSEDGYFMLSLSPGEASESAAPRDVTAVVDVSGSMAGEKMEQTRRALLQLLDTLGEEDRFRLIRFSNGVEVYRPEWAPAGTAALGEAREWVRALQAQGGTNIEGALEEAFRLQSPDDRLPVVVFLTDGMPTVGERAPEALADRAQARSGHARVFALGVGYDVDTHLLDRLAQAGRGTVEYVGPGEDVEHALGLLAAKVRHPVLTDLEMGEMPVRLREVYPSRLPDLFAGEDLLLFGRYVGAGEGALAMAGRREGRRLQFRTEGGFPEHAPGNDYIPRLWAARKIGELTREVRLGGPDPELVEEIRTTALRYGILTEYTAHLVLEPGQVAAGERLHQFLRDAPRAGRSAVLGSAAAGRARESRRAEDIVSMETVAMDAAGLRLEDRTPESRVRVVAGRAFRLQDGVWVDRLLDADEPEPPLMRIQAFSPAYFALLDELPELRRWWGVLNPVRVAGDRVALEVGEEGISRLSPADVRRLAGEFRRSPSPPRR